MSASRHAPQSASVEVAPVKRFVLLASFSLIACNPTRPPVAPEPAGPTPVALIGPAATSTPAPFTAPEALATDAGSLRIEVQGGTCDVVVDGRSLGSRARQEL